MGDSQPARLLHNWSKRCTQISHRQLAPCVVEWLLASNHTDTIEAKQQVPTSIAPFGLGRQSPHRPVRQALNLHCMLHASAKISRFQLHPNFSGEFETNGTNSDPPKPFGLRLFQLSLGSIATHKETLQG